MEEQRQYDAETLKSNRVIYLRASEVWRNPELPQITGMVAVWAISPAARFDVARTGDYYIPLRWPDAWITKGPRSTDFKFVDETGTWYRHFIGTGNTKKINYSPFLTNDPDRGHISIGAVSKKEVDAIKVTLQLLAAPNDGYEPYYYAPIDFILKLEEVPVPIDDSGGIDICSVVEAYTKPWAVHDHVRLHQIEMMRKRLLTTLPKAREDELANLDMEELVKLFFQEEGFFQINERQALPFRAEIGRFLCNPVVLDYVGNLDHSTPETQAKAVSAAYIEFLQSIGISREIDFSSILYLDTVSPVKDFQVQEDDAQIASFRPFLFSHRNSLPRPAIHAILKRFGLPIEGELVQIDGLIYAQRIYKSLPREEQERIDKYLTEARVKLIQTFARAVSEGLGLSQSVSSKDVDGDRISDLGSIGGYHSMRFDPIEERATLLVREIQADENSLRESLINMASLKGLEGEEYPVLMNIIDGLLLLYGDRYANLQTNPLFPSEYRAKYTETLHYLKDRYEQQYNHEKAEKPDLEMSEFYSKLKVPTVLLGILLSLD